MKEGIETNKFGWFIVRRPHNKHRFATMREAELFLGSCETRDQDQFLSKYRNRR